MYRSPPIDTSPASADSSLRVDRVLDPARFPLSMGVLNVTPDSFSDGGVFLSPDAAVARARQMISEGADIIDVGPESTRPGAGPVSASQQSDRALPVIEALRKLDDRVVISIDTRVAEVAQAAIRAGADLVNDVSALRFDRAMVEVVASSGVPVVLMHMRGTPETMQAGGGPHYDDLIGDVSGFFRERRSFAVSRGIEARRIIFDPGLGFGKRFEHNLILLRELERFVSLGQPVLVSASRKSFIGRALGIDNPKERDTASAACAAIAVAAGAAIIRTHEIRTTLSAVRIAAAVRRAAPVQQTDG